MREAGIDAIVAASPVSVAYLGGYRNPLDRETKEYMLTPGAGEERALPAFAAASVDGERAAVVPAVFAVGVGDGVAVFPVGRAPYEGGLDAAGPPLLDAGRWATAGEALAAALEGLGLQRSRIGLELDGCPSQVAAAVADRLPGVEILDCTSLLRLLRMVKTEQELERLRAAARAAETAAGEALGAARPGTALDDVARCYRIGLAGFGADLEHFAAGPRGFGISMHPAETLRRDDVLYVDFGCRLDGYRSDGGVTLALEPLRPDLDARYGALRDAVAAGAEALRAGARASGAARAMSNALPASVAGAAPPHGHGLGLQAREYPLVVPDAGLRIRDDCVDAPSDLELEVGMVVNLEASAFLPGVASLHVERSFVVGASGPLDLVPQDRRSPVIAGAASAPSDHPHPDERHSA